MYFKENRIFKGKLLIKKQRLKKVRRPDTKAEKKENYPIQEPKKRKTVRTKRLILKISLDSKNSLDF
jgi:hypothetical protein